MVLGAGKISNDAMIYSDSASSRTSRDDNIVKVEYDLPLF